MTAGNDRMVRSWRCPLWREEEEEEEEDDVVDVMTEAQQDSKLDEESVHLSLCLCMSPSVLSVPSVSLCPCLWLSLCPSLSVSVCLSLTVSLHNVFTSAWD